jgi:hypothetical protein
MISLSAVQNVLFTLQPKCETETICGTHYPKFSSTDRLTAYALHYKLHYTRVTCNYESQPMSHSHQCPVSYLQLTMLHSCQCPAFYLLTTWSSSVRLSMKFATTKYCWNQIICIFTYNRSFKSSVQTQYVGKHFSKKGRAIPLQAWTDPEGSKRLRLSDFKTVGIWRR